MPIWCVTTKNISSSNEEWSSISFLFHKKLVFARNLKANSVKLTLRMLKSNCCVFTARFSISSSWDASWNTTCFGQSAIKAVRKLRKFSRVISNFLEICMPQEQSSNCTWYNSKQHKTTKNESFTKANTTKVSCVKHGTTVQQTYDVPVQALQKRNGDQFERIFGMNSMSWMQWTRADVRAFPAVLGADDGRGDVVHHVHVQEMLPPSGRRWSEWDQLNHETVPSTADKERYDGDQWRYALYYFGSDQDLPSRQGECEDVVLAKVAEALVQGQWQWHTHLRSPTWIRNLALRTWVLGSWHTKKNLMYPSAFSVAKEHSWYSDHVNVQSHPWEKRWQAFAVTNSIEFKEVITSTHLCFKKKENLNKAA